ncbi:hypothetical protein CWI36_0426p0010 [Hamiltosporidium magnivora]|uniref:Uncharacterized protein n=1 Tax=Hamiltosporidium magnivora TaxID=148818 RepID=A0A4V2JW49_9MICR|nr:hypothetical protein CWI36_0426p0010 [Hamiltosporidium magnivora]
MKKSFPGLSATTPNPNTEDQSILVASYDKQRILQAISLPGWWGMSLEIENII